MGISHTTGFFSLAGKLWQLLNPEGDHDVTLLLYLSLFFRNIWAASVGIQQIKPSRISHSVSHQFRNLPPPHPVFFKFAYSLNYAKKNRTLSCSLSPFYTIAVGCKKAWRKWKELQINNSESQNNKRRLSKGMFCTETHVYRSYINLTLYTCP